MARDCRSICGRGWSGSSGRRVAAVRLGATGHPGLMRLAVGANSAACRAAFRAAGYGISHCALSRVSRAGLGHAGDPASRGTRLECKGLITPFARSCSAVNRMGSFAWERFFLAAHLHSDAQGLRLAVTCVLAASVIAVFIASVNSGNSGPVFKRGITMRQSIHRFVRSRGGSGDMDSSRSRSRSSCR